MRAIFVGGGASSLVGAILLKKKHPEMEVFIIEKSGMLGRKLSLTGNGKCNLAPLSGGYESKYNNPSFVKSLFEKIDDEEYRQTLKELGINTKYLDNKGLYPISESTKNVLTILNANIVKYSVQIIYENVLDYTSSKNGIIVKTDKQDLKCDYLFLGVGGKSYPKTGSDGAFFDVLQKHGYYMVPLRPALCPIKVKENVHDLFGARCKGKVSLLQKDKVLGVEEGEIMFKKDGLSGICVMNLSRLIQDDECILSLNLIEGVSKEDFLSYQGDNYSLLISYLPIPLAKYVLKILSLDNNGQKELLYKTLKDLRFTVKSLYGYDEAQVTRGGISLENIHKDFSSSIENNVYLLGEMLDIDGPCGGYNLRFALTSAFYCVKCFE